MSLREKVLSGLLWSGGVRVVGQLTNWAVTIVVIRILSPGDYGLLAMATVFMAMLGLLSEAGLGLALTRATQFDEATLRRVFGLVIVVNGVLFAAQFAAAPVIAKFYGEERLIAIIRVLGLQFLLSILVVIPGAMFQRRLDFKTGSLIGLASSIFGSLSALGLALAGFGVWALVISHLAGSLFTAILFNCLAPFLRWPEFSLNGMRGLVSVGAQITVTRALYFAYSQADVFIAGRILGKELLGFYSVSMHLASLPLQKTMSVLNNVAFPAFASIQQDREQVASAVLKMVRLVSLVGFPMVWGLASVSPEAVRVLLGEKWEPAIIPLQIIALIMPLRMLAMLLPSVTDSIGRADVALYNVIIACLIMPLAFLVGCQWGILGLSAAWIVAYPLVVLQNVQRTAKAIGMSTGGILAAARRPLGAAGVMYASVTGLRTLLPHGFPEWVRLLLLVAMGVAAYAIASWFINRQGIVELRALARR